MGAIIRYINTDWVLAQRRPISKAIFTSTGTINPVLRSLKTTQSAKTSLHPRPYFLSRLFRPRHGCYVH
jgi:hypothetical protein